MNPPTSNGVRSNGHGGSTSNLPTRTKRMSLPSVSVPSTPRQPASSGRRTSRTPSPGRRSRNRSLPSGQSDSRSPATFFHPERTTCRFMSTQTSRRRIPYTIGTDVLEQSTEHVKESLKKAEQDKLSEDMRDLYNQLLPTPKSQTRRGKVVEKLRSLLEQTWPGKDINVYMFGSSGNLLYTSKSDVDICITMKELESTCALAAALSKHGMERVTCVHAKAVPIVKIWDPELNLACDLNVNNHVAVKNTQLIKTYIEIDERIRPLAMTIKHWAKKRILNEASGGTLSSYTWTLLIINFLQTRNPPILPVIALENSDGRPKDDFSADLTKFRGFGAANTETLGGLLFSFFRLYGHEIDYETAVVSVRHGRLLTKEEKGWTTANNNRLCVEEPFNTDRNLANTADDTAFRGLHLELRQAFDRIADGLDVAESVCEKYEFPKEEPKTIFERPQAGPKPVLTRSASQSGRRGNNARGGKYSNNGKNGQSNRRASSGAMFGNTTSAFPPATHLSGLLPDYFLQMAQPQQLHNHLVQMQQDLQAREFKLKAFQLMQVQAAQQQAMAQSNSRASSVSSQPRGASDYLSPRLSGFDSMSPNIPSYHAPFPYPYQVSSPVPMSQSSSQQGTDTDPSSPSLASATLRRGAQRNSGANGTSGPSVRSQSQPARPIGNQHGANNFSRPMNGAASATGQIPNRFDGSPYFPAGLRSGYYTPVYGGYPSVAMYDPAAIPMPREYVGYVIGESPQLHPQYVDPRLPHIPPYEDFMRFRGRGSPSLHNATNPLGSPFNEPSRSPSPNAGAGGDEVNGVSPHVLPEQSQSHTSGFQPPAQPDGFGPFIVNGSHHTSIGGANSGTQPPEPGYQLRYAQTEPSDLGMSASSGYSESSHADQTPAIREQIAYIDAVAGNGLGLSTNPSSVPPVLESPPPRKAKGSASPRGIQPTELTPPPTDEPTTSSRMSPELRQRVNRRVSSAAKVNVVPLDLSKTIADHIRDEAPKSAPLLSPVLETRTPSPTANRKTDFRRDSQVNGSRVTAPSSPLAAISSHAMNAAPVPTAPGSDETNGVAKRVPNSSVNPNPWQLAGKKTHRKNKSSLSLPPEKAGAGDTRSKAESLPANAAERKGG